jgi:amino acid transporter
MMFMMLFAVLSLSSLSSRYGGSGIAIPAALQVMGKASAAGVSLILGVLSVRRYVVTRGAFAEARKG